MDLDGSGRLALVILNYVVFGPKEKQYCELTPGVKSGCPPEFYRSEFPQLLRNEGNGRFQDVTASSGLKDTHGAALVLAFADTTGSGRMDFYVGNDTRPADLMRNLGGLRFHNVALQSGVALAGSRGVAAMGADWGDFDRDGRPDLIVTAFSRGTFPLFQNLGDGPLRERQRLHRLEAARPTSRSGSARSGLTWTTTAGPIWRSRMDTCMTTRIELIQGRRSESR